jgi:hypothetical protein
MRQSGIPAKPGADDQGVLHQFRRCLSVSMQDAQAGLKIRTCTVPMGMRVFGDLVVFETWWC